MTGKNLDHLLRPFWSERNADDNCAHTPITKIELVVAEAAK